MYRLYGGKYTRSGLVEQVLAECGAEFELREVDTAKGEQRSPEFLKINPAGWVPALVTEEDAVFYETPAINLYLAEKHLSGELVPVSDDPDRGLFLSGLFYITGMLEPALKRYWFPDRYAGGRDNQEAVKRAAFQDVTEYFTVIDNRLSSFGPFHLGDRYSLVDLMVAYWSESFLPPDNIDHLSSIARCHELVYQRPNIRDLKYSQRDRIREYHELWASGAGFGSPKP
jgi:glutathione S-transferase